MNEEQERKWCVYKHTNKTNGKVYIGQTGTKVEHRWRNGEGYKNCPLFWKAICKYGWNNFEHEVIAKNLTQEEANATENQLILKYNSNNPLYGYNLTSGGDHSIPNEIARKAISESHMGEKNCNWGKPRTEETRKKISESNKGKQVSQETRRKLSKSLQKENHPNWGKHLSEETKRKIGEANQGRESKFRKKVICIETQIIYKSISEAAKLNNLHESHITKCCKHQRKTCGGYHWEYYEESN